LPRAGLGEQALEVLRWAVTDPTTVERFRGKVARVPGSACSWFTGALTGHGHGRFWLATSEGRGVVVVAHRFAWAVAVGVDDLLSRPVLAHGCDNPLCQRIGPGHVQPSTAARNRAEFLMRRATVGSPLRDARGSLGRAAELRAAVLSDGSPESLAAAQARGMTADAAQPPLWLEPLPGESSGCVL
jgi:hypothetical protein